MHVITGINHITLSVRNLEQSFSFYTEVLGLKPIAKPCAAAIHAHGVSIWQDNKSEGDSLYFLDPDGHKLEIHVGDLESRLMSLQSNSYEGLQLFI